MLVLIFCINIKYPTCFPSRFWRWFSTWVPWFGPGLVSQWLIVGAILEVPALLSEMLYICTVLFPVTIITYIQQSPKNYLHCNTKFKANISYSIKFLFICQNGVYNIIIFYYNSTIKMHRAWRFSTIKGKSFLYL